MNKILLIEDNPADQIIFKEALKHGCNHAELDVAGDGDEAFDHLSDIDSLPNVIVLDLNIPKKDGHEILTEIKSNEQLKHIPVIIFTSSHDRHDVCSCYDLNANCFLTKPNHYSEYIQLVKLICDFWIGKVMTCAA